VIDLIDKNILAILRNRASIPFLEISKELKVSESTLRHGVRHLEAQGIIKRYSASIDTMKIGYGSGAYVGIDMQPEKFLEVAHELTRFDNVKMVSTTSRDHLIMAEIWGEKAAELREFISNRIAKITGVVRTCPAIITETLKDK